MSRIGVVGNLANVGYELVRALDGLGEHARLVAPRDRLDAWRRVAGGDPEDDPLLDLVAAGPHWSPWTMAALRRYDVLVSVCLAGTPVLPFLGRPYVSYATGSDLRELAGGAPIYPRLHAALARRTFRSAASVVHSVDNPLVDAALRLGLRNLAAAPHFVDLPFWQATPPAQEPAKEGLIVLSPANLQWKPQFPGQAVLKRNDILITGFAHFLESGGTGRLVVLRRGAQADELGPLLEELGISDSVEIIDGGVDREGLRDLFARAHVVGDQFSPEGGLGVTSIEVMAAGRALLASRADPAVSLVYGDDPPPVAWANDADEVASRLHALRDRSSRQERAAQGAAWAARRHDPRRLAERYRDIIRAAAHG